MCKDLEQLSADLSSRQDGNDRGEPLPVDGLQRQAVFVRSALLHTVVRLLAEGCGARMVELALFAYWYRLIALVAGLEDEAADMPCDRALATAVNLLKAIAAEIVDDGPSPQRTERDGLVSALKRVYRETAHDMPGQVQLDAQVETVNTALPGVIGLLLKGDLPVSFVQNGLLYLWLRLFTLSTDVDEALFRKIEGNWPNIVCRFNPAYIAFMGKPGRVLH